jgi:hypothetical protein
VAAPAIASDGGVDDPFGCAADGDCMMSACGAVNRRFSRANHQKMVRPLGCAGGCQGHLDTEARCRDGICMVPSDSLCSPGLLADAGPPEEFGWVPPDSAALSIQERLFVLPDIAARESRWLAEPDIKGGFWTPTFDDVIAIDARLRDTLAASCDPQARRIARRLPAYRGQFVGIVKSGRRLIAGNYLCSVYPDTMNLTRFWIVTSDGGECFFHFWYDPATGTFRDISVNGYA